MRGFTKNSNIMENKKKVVKKIQGILKNSNLL